MAQRLEKCPNSNGIDAFCPVIRRNPAMQCNAHQLITNDVVDS
jgi:hypothetical protein